MSDASLPEVWLRGPVDGRRPRPTSRASRRLAGSAAR